MRFKTYTGITWSVLELTGLLEDEDSRVYFEKFRKHIGLHPFHMTNLNAALNEILSSNLNSYDHDIQGFLLAYKNPKLLTPLGDVFYDTCFIHVDIEADFYVFRPEVGCTLRGIVNKKGLDHIGLLVHKAFNVSIPKLDDEENWPGDNVEIGQEVRCVVKLLDFTSKLPFIRGVLDPDEYLRGCRLTPKSVNKRKKAEKSVNKVTDKSAKKHTHFATDSEGSSNDQGKEQVVQRKKSKRKSEQEEPVDHTDEPNEKKKKKSKKHDKKVKEPNESTTRVKLETAYNSVNGDLMSTEETEESTSSGIEVKKKIRARNSRGSIDNDGSESRIDVKSEIKTKIKVQSSQSSVDEDNDDRNSIKRSSKKISKTLSSVDSKDSIRNIKFEPRAVDNDVEVTEENIVERKPKIKLSSLEQNRFVDVDGSPADFRTEKNRKSSKKIKRELFSDIDVHDLSDSVQGTPKKRHKKDKLKSEVSESEAGNSNVDEASIKKGSRKSNGLDFEHTSRYIKIKKETVTSSTENIADEDVNDRAVEETEEATPTKKKSKKHSRTIPIDTRNIKVEPGFQDVIVKVEPNDDYEENTHVDQVTENVSKSNSKKKHRTHVDDVADDNIINAENNVKQSKKTKRKTMDETDLNNSDINLRSPEKKKKRHSKSSSNKEESGDRESGVEPSFDFRDVKIKKERFTDS
ncbi:uncharacterized protein LOC108630656 [Ceratina calcarata]|uniref:Uncharacterized protein LOC108630656 n=1 Tax=Ceratina calcarata TaxID=156304 RepID=A0AAJ7JBJ3_9HYME|nr:uncharacterized protein LOC108630656 [Ceratina calcarata]